MAKQKFYVVWKGRQPGIYNTWEECQQHISGYPQAKYKSFPTREEAELAYNKGWQEQVGLGKKKSHASNKSVLFDSHDEIEYNSISVDVGTRGNPGPIEYQGVDTKTGEVLFQVGPIENGTNNLGEFIAIVHALAYLKQNQSNKAVYSDSLTAIKWIRNKKVASTLKRDKSTEKVWELTDRALTWLHENRYENKILKWNTHEWGEIKADYGRK